MHLVGIPAPQEARDVVSFLTQHLRKSRPRGAEALEQMSAKEREKPEVCLDVLGS